MLNFTTRETFLIPSFDLEVKEREKLDKFLLLLEKSNIDEFFPKDEDNGRNHYSYYDLLATILYGFAFSNSTLRQLETACKFDLRYFYLMEQKQPKHTAFGDFINNVILPNRDEIFKRITNQIIKECNLIIDDVFIDGSKFEANANKYKFVWKPTKFHEKLSDKIRKLLDEVKLSNNVPSKGIIESKLIASKVKDLDELLKDNDKYKNNYELLCEYLLKALEYEEKERICGNNRNSYYKTDKDATAMCLKEDYYSGLGSNMHAAYNTQILVSKGIICSYYISNSRNDIKDFIPILERFYKCFDYYPKRVCADAGYGSLENYRYLFTHDIENFVKHFSFEGEVSGKNPNCYHLIDNTTIICLNNNIGKEISLPFRHPRKANSVFFKVEGCNSCLFKDYCKRYMKNKYEDFKIFEVVKELEIYKEESLKNLLSPKGIELRVNRSSQVEGAFGVIKQDMNYTRLRRISLEKVETEFMLTSLGYNLRKLFRYFDGKAKFNYWIAPGDLKKEEVKKPSAKRLSNKANKKNNKSINEKAKSEYKYK